MSSKNQASITALISAIQGGLNEGQNTDLMSKIAFDLDQVYSWVQIPGSLPRVLNRSEIDPLVAYLDIANIFTKQNSFAGLTLTGGASVAGSIIKSASGGLVIELVTGSAHDFELLDPGGNIIGYIPTGTKKITLTDILTSPQFNIIQTAASVGGAGSIWGQANNGIIFQIATGATNDFVMLNPGATFAVMAVPTGTVDLSFGGKLFNISYLETTKMAAPGNSPANTGRFFLRDNGAGKMQFAAIFPSGAIQPIVTEP